MLMSLLKVQAHMNVIVNHWCWGRWWWLACFPYIKKKNSFIFFPRFSLAKTFKPQECMSFHGTFYYPSQNYSILWIKFGSLRPTLLRFSHIYAPGVHVLFSIKRGHLHPKTHPLALVTFWEKMTIMVKSNLDIICN